MLYNQLPVPPAHGPKKYNAQPGSNLKNAGVLFHVNIHKRNKTLKYLGFYSYGFCPASEGKKKVPPFQEIISKV
jgi:hypothetical protein